jgi:hypothetical protein
MSTQAIITAGYHRPDLAVKLEILRSQHGYTESKVVGLYNKTMTLAVIRGGELLIAEGRLERSAGGFAKFFPKGHRTADDTWDVRGIIGHAAGYGHTPVLSHNALAEFAAITPESVRFYLTSREQAAQQEAARQTAAEIARICSYMQGEQEERQADDSRILALLDASEATHSLAA